MESYYLIFVSPSIGRDGDCLNYLVINKTKFMGDFFLLESDTK